MKIAPLETKQGIAAETSAAGVLQVVSTFGIPVSTTYTIASAIVGAGAAFMLLVLGCFEPKNEERVPRSCGYLGLLLCGLP